MSKSKKVIVAGHVCLDITPVFSKQMPEGLNFTPGGLIHLDSAAVHMGGLVANTGLAMKFFGMDVKLMGKIGNDRFGQIILSELEALGTGSHMIIAEGETTAYSIVLAPPGIDRCFLHCPGANNTFSMADILGEDLKESVLFHFGYPTLMASMYRNSGFGLEQLLHYVHSMGLVISMDMSCVDPNSEAGKQNWLNILEKVLKYTDIFLPSVEEIFFMLNMILKEDFSMEDICFAGRQLIGLGVGIVVIKCGARGLYYKTGFRRRLWKIEKKLGISLKGWENREGFIKSFQPLKVVSATGAGDTSIAAFLSAMLMGYSFMECLDLMAATGACCVENYDAFSGLQSFSELKDKIAHGWKRQGGFGNAGQFE